MARLALLASAFASSAAADQVLLVGFYKKEGAGANVRSWSINGKTLAPLASSTIDEGPSWIIPAKAPSWVIPGEVTTVLAVSETVNGTLAAEQSGTVNGTVSSLSLDCKGNLVSTSCVGTEGAAPVFLATDPQSREVLVANYGGGSVSVLPLTWNDHPATLKPASQTLEFGANAHAHSAYFAPDNNPSDVNRDVFVPTLGLDEVQQLQYKGSNAKLAAKHPPLSVLAQQGPRHMAFHPRFPIAVLSNEGSASANVTIELLAVDQQKGLSTLATYPASGPYSAPDLYPAEVVIDERGHFVLVSLRDSTDQKRDGVAVFKVEPFLGKSLTFVDYVSVGHYPRSMTLVKESETSFLLVAANQKGNSLSFLHLDTNTGKLTKAKDDMDVGDSPAFVGVVDLAAGCSREAITIVV